MDELINSILRGLITYSIWIFMLLGAGFLIYLRKLFLAINAWKGSVFGLERDIAKRRLVSAATGLFLLILMFLGEFVLVTVISPQLPVDPTTVAPVIDPLMASTSTGSSDAFSSTQVMTTPEVEQTAPDSECEEGVLEITSPKDGDTISGTVEIIGTVNIEDFGSYKYEYSPTGAVDWVTIAAGNSLKLDENLGYWYTSALPPGIYYLQLVPLDNIGEELSPCIIAVEVVAEE